MRTLTQKHIGLQNGFTILELVIVIFLSGVVMVAVLNIFDWQNKVYKLQDSQIKSTGSARASMDALTSVISQSTNVETSRTISGTLYTSGAGTIVLKVPSINSSNDLINSTFDYVVFYSSGANLFQRTEAAVGSVRVTGLKKLSDTLHSLALTYDNATLSLAEKVTVNLQTRAYYRDAKFTSIQLEELVYIRN